MSGGRAVTILRNTALASATLFGAQSGVANDNGGSLMTAETIMSEMPVRDRFIYVSGIVEGFAHRRLEDDTLQSGERDVSGMACIHQWFYDDDDRAFQLIQVAFDQYPQHFPATIISVVLARECGE